MKDASGEMTTAGMLRTVLEGYEAAAREIVPWFYDNLPEYYFRTHTPEDQARHVHAVISSRISGEGQTVALKSPCGTQWTYITPGSWVKELLEVLDQFSATALDTVRIISSLDGSLRITDLIAAPQPRAARSDALYRHAFSRLSRQLSDPTDPGVAGGLKGFLTHCSRDYLEKFDEKRALRHFEAAKRLHGRESVEVILEPDFSPGIHRIMVNMAAPPMRAVLPFMVRILARRALNIDRAYTDRFSGQDSRMLLTSFYVRCDQGCLEPESESWKEMAHDLAMVKWHTPHGLDALAEDKGWTMNRVALVKAACEFAHQFLIKKDFYAYTSDNIVRAVLRDLEPAALLLDYFEARFDPMGQDREADAARAEEKALEAVANVAEPWRAVFEMIHRFFQSTLRTNYFLPTRFGLAFRLSPSVLDEPIAGERPYGIFFIHGPMSLAFHVRFRETARGGLRIVPTRNQARFELESNRLFDEAAALARTQQDKNKDIPEGGAKAVLLLGPEADRDISLKAMVNSLLDVILPSGEAHTLPEVVDYLNKREIIYLGPDENITPEHIEWIVARAAKRGYPWPASFMSSKAETGINHKKYGVTSLGVVVYVEEILGHLGIEPKSQPFRVKFTGGPAGDVASNAMKILMRRYRDNARIVAVSDGHGAAFDPQGLDHAELARLIKAESSISAFNPEKLKSKEAFAIAADSPANTHKRDGLHNEALAEVFIPAGGRPDTMNAGNWSDFLTPSGEPSARAIIEGANIFISPEARSRLEDHGVLIVRGSSANKTGVICSSYEILAALTLTAEEFVAIKKRFVADVLHILQTRARDEARLLVRELKRGGRQARLTEISARISREINSLADEIIEFLSSSHTAVSDDKELAALLWAYCPPILAEKYAARVTEQVPLGHQFALLGHFIAGRIVYSEGLGWLPSVAKVRDVKQVVAEYLRQEKKLARILERISKSRLADKNEIKRILATTGRKYLTMEGLGL